jgi:dihydrolipoamide dehydrogenase
MTSNDLARTVDVAVIGAGTAGLAAYRAASAVTSRVLLIEGGAYGTTCARVGCMPSKLLIAAADAAHRARSAAPFGVEAKVVIDGRAVLDRVRRERDRFVSFVVEGVGRIPEEHHLVGRARFTAPGVLDVGGARVEARAVVVATGSSPVIPAMLDPIRDRVVVNDDVFAWESLPESVAVFGAGVIGLELGQALHRLGVRVRVFGRGGRLGPITDPVVREAALGAFRAELALQTDARVRDVERTPDGVAVTFEDDEGHVVREPFAWALVAAGRRPNLAGLGIEHAGISLPVSGRPDVDRETLQWGDGPVFLAGDANDDVPLLHEAADEGRIAGDNAARFPDVRSGPRRSRLAIAFCDPGIAIVGPGYAALAKERPLVAGAVSFDDQGRSRVMLENRGACRVYADPASGRFLGAEIAGPRAEHMGHLLAWAHQQRLTVDQMLEMPFYHPVVEEGVRTALRDASARLRAGDSAR